MSLQVSLDSFRASITLIRTYVSIAFQTDPATGHYILTSDQREFITDSAFLKVFIAWESFLESAFNKYMLGIASINGIVIARHASPRDEVHANDMLIGTQKYVDWTRGDVVVALSRIYFDPGNPFEVNINSLTSDLQDLKTVRNSAAHMSSTTSIKLDALATRLLGTRVIGATVSSVIFAVDPTSTTSSTFFDVYLSKLDVAAEAIANA
ncbi:hypothetical protein MUGA111182_07030 [Mucilaginibacter galii]|uniref:Uncharacterized protein n=1 Tax=Mucilaginibacter galii TaxID=2005073 RepID=A0A917JAL9_9SPHI|nr:hypothetical protein [Mucilaginibacter galii]GGI51594.1 hypothetical protein GCM10011425_28060 [Mucilaginibacter galii]